MSVETSVPSDSELVQAVLTGDRQAYACLFARHERSVLAVALAILGNYHAAQDVAQEAFVKAYQCLGGLRQRSSFGPWVRQIAQREAFAVRRRTRQTSGVQPPAAPHEPACDDGTLDERNRLLLEAITGLPKHEQDVLLLYYFEGHSVKTISEMTGRPVGTVTMQLSRARSRLQKRLKESAI